jgi:hypothetical protein
MPQSPARRPSALPRLAAGAIAVTFLIAACTGRGGGWLPPDGVVFTGAATMGFAFSCERSSRSTNTNPPTGRLRIELSYRDHGISPIGAAFSILGIPDVLEPVVESAACVGQEPPPGGNELIFLGRYSLTSGAPTGFARGCAGKATTSSTACRFEVIVRDNDGDMAPSSGDFFSIKLSTVTDATITDLPIASVFYTRAGFLGGGNLTVN